MNLLAQRINKLTESETLQMAKLCRELRSQGFDIIDLSLGEPDYDTPQHIKDAAKKAIDDGYTHYTPVAGFADLRKAISDKFKRENNLDFSPEQIIVSTGAKQSIANVMLVLLDADEEVIVPSPYWVSYREMIKLADAKIVTIQTSMDNHFKMTPAQLENAITPKTKMLCFSSPCNPTGSVYSKKELNALSEVLASHQNIFVLSDEIYEHITYTGSHESIAQFKHLKDRVIVVNGCSKGFAMTGWRIGYIGAPLWIAKGCDKMQGQITSGTSSVSQRAALAALTSDMTPTYNMREGFKKRRELISTLINEIPGMLPNHPDGAFYFFPDISYYFGKSFEEYSVNSSDDFCKFLLYHAKVSVVTGNAFGDKNCIRISYAISEENIVNAFKRMKNSLALLK